MHHKVSIVIIGRNEERGITKCIDAAVTAAEQIGGAEMIYVDSNSTDNTVSVVENYGVRVLSLSPELRPSPSAGRFMGSLHAKGEFILFLDADTLIYEDFLPTALEYFANDSTLAGINGYIDDLNEAGDQLFDIEERPGTITDIKWLRGACCFYRREALLQAASFNPNLATEEEAELGLRLIQKGWKLKVFPQKMACHTRCYHGQSIESIVSTFRRDIRSGRLGEITRTTAYAFRAGNGLAFCWLRQKTTIPFAALLMAISVCLFLPDFLYPRIVLALMVFSGGAAIFAKKRSVYQTLLFVPAKILCLVDLLAGLNKIKVENTLLHSLEHSSGRRDPKRDPANGSTKLEHATLRCNTIPVIANEDTEKYLGAAGTRQAFIVTRNRGVYKKLAAGLGEKIINSPTGRTKKRIVNHKVSIVIIGRNEERSIAKCIEAAMTAAEQIGGAEMIYIDSHSTDNTVSIVNGYGVRVLSLSPELSPSPSAGRFMGSQFTQGDFILFLDADTLVYKDYLPIALEYFNGDLNLGGLSGFIDDLNEAGELLSDIEKRPQTLADTKWLRGACCVYRRQALLRAGSFNPHLATEEEAELGLRLMRIGWSLKIIPRMMACHTRCYHGQSIESIVSTFRRDIRSGRLGEITRTIAYAFRAGNGMAFCWLRHKTTLLFLGWTIALGICLFLPDFLQPRTIAAILVLSGGLATLAKKRSLSQTLLFTPAKILCVVDLLAGLHKINDVRPTQIYSLNNSTDQLKAN